MHETTSFLRYVLPGLISIVEFLGYLLISGDLCPYQLLEWETGLAGLVGAFLASGTLGFLWQVFYYQVVEWIVPLQINYRTPLEDAESRGWLKLQCHKQGREVKVSELTQKGAWRVGTSYFSMRVEASKRIKGADRRMNRFADLAHGLGATVVGSVIALVVFLGVNILRAWPGELSCRGSVSFVLGSAILCLLYCNFRRLKEHCEIVYAMILLKDFEIRWENKKLREPIRLYVFQRDLKKEKNKPQGTSQ